jgi:hypothetical protein
MIGIDEIKSDRGLPQPNLTGPGVADVDICKGQHIGAARSNKLDRIHYGSLIIAAPMLRGKTLF